MNWLCWHVGASVDPKLKLIAKRTGANLSYVVHAWAYHLERAAEGDPRGSFGNIDPDEAELATDIPRPIWMAVTIAFEERGLTSDGMVVNFDKRNYGNSTLRVRAFRERQKRLKQGETLQIPSETLPVVPETLRNATGEERREYKIINPKTANGSNGHTHTNGSGNGIDLDLNPLSAKRAFRTGAPTKEELHEKFEARTMRFAYAHYSQDACAEMVALQLSDDPRDKQKRKDVFNAADSDYQQRKLAGTLQPMSDR